MPPSLFRTYELNLRNVTCLIEKKMQMLTLGGQYPVLTRENPHPRRGFPAHCLTADPLCPRKALHPWGTHCFSRSEHYNLYSNVYSLYMLSKYTFNIFI
jgi:hypothetical protein